MFDEIIKNNEENILNTLSELIKFPSVSDESGTSAYPFGKACNDVLNYVLDLGNSMGFKTKNIDGYCGYIEFGEGEELVGIIGHLDVVPANEDDGWTTPPFLPTIRDGKLFGRGSVDDKGPVVASLYAMKAIKDTTNISKRVRLILGLNEEKSWKCINYYKEHEEAPSIGFSPDANFPAIYAEKGIMSVELKNDFKIKDYDILEIDCKNNAINVVPKYCSIKLKKNYNANSNLQEIENIRLTETKDTIVVEAFGTSAHAAHPELGDNAIKRLVEYLINNFQFENAYLKTLYEIGLFDIHSPKFMSAQKLEDESGILTSNVAVLDYTQNKLIIQINLRIPVTISLDDIFSKYTNLNFENLEVKKLNTQEPLYVEKNTYLVKTLVNIFNNKTNLKESPIAIGGGTYARAFPNFVSYGATMPGDKDMCHQVNEFIEIDKLILSSKIYAEAIYELANNISDNA